MKLINTEGKQYTAEILPVGATVQFTVQFTVTGVNAAGEGHRANR